MQSQVEDTDVHTRHCFRHCSNYLTLYCVIALLLLGLEPWNGNGNFLTLNCVYTQSYKQQTVEKLSRHQTLSLIKPFLLCASNRKFTIVYT